MFIIFFCLMVFRPWLNLPTGGHGHVIYMDNLGGVFFYFYHEWLRMTNAFILCDILWKVQKSHAANREGSFNVHIAKFTWPICSCSYIFDILLPQLLYVFTPLSSILFVYIVPIIDTLCYWILDYDYLKPFKLL